MTSGTTIGPRAWAVVRDKTLAGHEFLLRSRQFTGVSLQWPPCWAALLTALLLCKRHARKRVPRPSSWASRRTGACPTRAATSRSASRRARDPSKRVRVASLGLLDPAAGKRFLIDATPDFADQIEALGGLPDGILLTHAHIGHYLGLAQLGREVLGARRVPVYCTPSMAAFLREQQALEPARRAREHRDPRSRARRRVRADARACAPRRSASRTATKTPTPWPGSCAARRARILWLPDIDKWEKWDRSLEDLLADPALTAFVDGTFFSADEIPGRAIARHPAPARPGDRGARSPPDALGEGTRLLRPPQPHQPAALGRGRARRGRGARVRRRPRGPAHSALAAPAP